MPHKLLLADDSVTIQRVIELTFADEDVSVTAVGDGKQAIERIGADPPDIVLADVGMPEKDGYEVAEFVKNTPRLAHIPVLLLTGAFEPVDEARAARVGCDGVLAKPFEPQMVITRVRELLTANIATASRPTPQLIQPPPRRPVLKPELEVPPPTPVRLEPPEPLPPPPPPPFSAGPTPIVPLTVAPPPPPEPPAVPEPVLPEPVPVQTVTPNEIELRLPVPEESGASLTPAPFAEPVEIAAPEPVVEAQPAAAKPAPEPPMAEPAAAMPAPEPPMAEPAAAMPAPEPPMAEPVLDDRDRSPEEAAVESAIDAVIRIRRRPLVTVPEVGVPPKAAEPEPGMPAQLDDYFDRLDAKFANLSQGREKRPVAEPVAPVAGPIEAPPPDERPVAEAAVDVPPPPEPLEEPAPPRHQTSGGLAQAFSALLDAERGEPGHGPVVPLFAPPSISPALREELVEQVARRVLEQLSDRVVRETVTDLVSRVTERLVREEIERLKATVK